MADFPHRTTLCESTKRNHRQLLDHHILPKWGDKPVSGVKFEDYVDWLTDIQSSPNVRKDKKKGGLGASQTNGIHTVMGMVMDWAKKTGKIPSNPIKGAPLPKQTPKDHVYLTYKQVETLAVKAGQLTTRYGQPTATAHVNRVLILVLAYTGIRCGEAAALRVGSVDLAKRRIHITASLNEDGELYEDAPKNGEPRTVPIAASLVSELKKLMGKRPKDAYLFSTQRGHQIRMRNWRNREFVPACQEAKLDKIGLTPHKLRHTAASLAIAAGADVYVVQRMLGHAKPSITLDVYGGLWPDKLDEVADVMDTRRIAALAKAA